MVMSFSFTACSDDDDDDGGSGSPSTTVSVITTDDGERRVLKRIRKSNSLATNFTFEYDNQGRCTYASAVDSYKMSYDPFKLTYADVDDDESYDFSVSFNNLGYMSKLSMSGSSGDKNDGEESSGTYNFTYDDSGHLTEIIMSASGTDYTGGTSVKWTSSCTSTLIWSDGNLISEERDWLETEGGRVDWDCTETITYEYGSTYNKYNVYPLEMLELGNDLISPQFALIGYLGKGTAYLPSALIWRWEKATVGDEGKGKTNWTLSYKLNSNGTIATEYYERSSIASYYNAYSYSTLAESSSDVAAELDSEVSADAVKTLVRGMLHRRHARAEE